MASPARTSVALFALLIAIGILAFSIFRPWWVLEREFRGSTEDQSYGPFHQDPTEDGDDFRTPTRILGALVVVAILFLAAAALVAAIRIRSDGASAGAARAFSWIGAVFILASALYSVWAFPQEANDQSSSGRPDLGWNERSCSELLGTEYCFESRAGSGWFLAWAGFPGAFIGGLLVAGRPRGAEEKPRKRTPERIHPGPLTVAARAAGRPTRGIPPGTTRVVKCGQCQTRVSFTRNPQGTFQVSCTNCGALIRT